MADHVGDKWYCSAGTAFFSRSQRYIRACHQIWKCILPKHPAYDMEDLGDDTPGFSREPITPKMCIEAWWLLNELYSFDTPLLDWCLEIYTTIEGGFEFEWYFDRGKSCFIEITNFDVERDVMHRLTVGKQAGPMKELVLLSKNKVDLTTIEFLTSIAEEV